MPYDVVMAQVLVKKAAALSNLDAQVDKLSADILGRVLPQGVKTELGPDATGLGWVYQYALEDKSGKHTLADLRSLQDVGS